MRGIFLALMVAAALAVPALAEQAGTLAAGASITLDTAKDDLTEIVLKNESAQEITIDASGAATRSFKVGPMQTVGTLGPYKGAKLTLTNKGPGPIEYKISW